MTKHSPILSALLGASLLAASALAACTATDTGGEPAVDPPDASPDAAPALPPSPAPSAPPAEARLEHDPDYLEVLPHHDAQLKVLCDRKGQDTVSKVFCAKPGGPKLTGLKDLAAALGLAFKDPTKGNGTLGNPAFAVTGHSSSLVMRHVSAANPRVVVFTPPLATGPNPSYVALGFTRGEQLVELATRDPSTGEPAFYLLKYEQQCNATKSCTTKDLVGPATESGWTAWTLYEDEDLANTALDCLRCHQPSAKQRPLLRMQERLAPFTHWMATSTAGGRALLADYHSVHGHGEDYGPIPAALFDASDPALLAKLVDQNNAQTPQPNPFDAPTIEREVLASSPAQPTLNDPPGKSAAWQKIFDVAAGAGAIRVPYHDVKIADGARLDAFGAAYRAMTAGKGDLVADPRTLVLESAKVDLGLRPRPGASGAEIVKQMCGECHNARLDPTLSRARFDATRLEAMPPSERAIATARVALPASDRLRMPPAVFGELSAEEIAKVKEALR